MKITGDLGDGLLHDERKQGIVSGLLGVTDIGEFGGGAGDEAYGSWKALDGTTRFHHVEEVDA